VLDAVATMGSSYGFPVVDAIGRSIALSNGYRYPALCRVVIATLDLLHEAMKLSDLDAHSL